MSEERAVEVFLDYLKEAGRGKWEGNRGPDPPDFIIANQQVGEIAAVEHTRFFWPPEELTLAWALQKVKQDVNRQIVNRVEGVFGVSIDHANREAFSESFSQLSRKNRRHVAEWLAREIASTGTTMGVTEEKGLHGPLPCRLIRFSDSGLGEMAWLRSMSTGSDLGVRPVAVQKEGEWYSRVERLDRPNTVLSELEATLRRKAEQIKSVEWGSRILLIEYFGPSLDLIKPVLNVPERIDELYFLALPGPEIVECHPEP